MFSVYLLFALIFSTVGSPYPASSHEFDDPGSVSSNFAGSDVFGSDTLSAAKEVPNADSTPTFSLASSPDDSFFTDEPSDFSGLKSLDPTISVNLPSNPAVSGVGADEDMFGATTLDDSLPGGLFNIDGFVEPFDVAAQHSTGATDACVSEVTQSIAKQKRVACQNPETEIKTDPDTQTENQAENQRRPLLDEDTLRRMSGLDQPDLLQTTLCGASFEPVCCTGQDYLGLLQTGCSKYSVSDWKNMDCYDRSNILCCIIYNPEPRTASSCYSPMRDPARLPKKVPEPLNVLNDDPLGSLFQPPN